ncbi:MAG: DNA polymerase/3'-5' exonuclease PolX [Asgard group archaeon]|nr:DNA polymerase/3'-5' exonuclease PolX [Asgard group archaeon]
MKNVFIAEKLEELADLLSIKEQGFRVRAYRQAAQTVRSLSTPIEEIAEQGDLQELPGIGSSIAKKIKELLDTGELTYYKKLKKEYPVEHQKLLAVEGLGPKTLKLLYEELGITTLEELEKAAKEHKIRDLPGMGEKSEQNLLNNIEFVKRFTGRKILGFILPLAEKMSEKISEQPYVQKVALAGSIRRRKETIGDLDFLVQTTQPQEMMNYFIKMDNVEKVIATGESKSTVRLEQDLDADLRVIPPESYGAALLYFTGSKEMNIILRRIARDKDMKLNEYGLFKGEEQVAGKTEKEVFEKLGLDFIPPELRENTGEVEAAQKGTLPDLLKYDDLRGDLQMHTTWSDGKHSIREMAEAAKELGHEYIAITDHVGSLRVAGGMNEKEIQEQMRKIDRIDEEIEGIRILKGAEVNIDSKGELDMPNTILKDLDVVVASIHSGFRQGKEKMTARVLSAMNNEYVDIIAHPTGRIIQEREGYELDFNTIFEKSKETNTFLEINAYPNRLDLRDAKIRDAINHNCKLFINTDSHSTEHLGFIILGIATARRGWAEKKDILNTLPWKDVEKILQK